MHKKTNASLAALLLLGASLLVSGCGSDKSPAVSQDVLNSKGAQKGASFEQLKQNTKAVNPGAPGGAPNRQTGAPGGVPGGAPR